MTYPVILDGAQFSALVVGGGEVASRKARSLLDGGIPVTVVAPAIGPAMSELARDSRVAVHERPYQEGDVGPALVVIAATDDAAVNQRVATDARAKGRLVNVVDDPDAGNFITPAVHRSGDLTIAISTGRTPAAAVAIRAAVARRFDGRYGGAIAALRGLRERLLGVGARSEWKRASAELIGEDFCERVERGDVEREVASWR